MPTIIDNGSTAKIVLYAVLASDHITPATGKTIAITISKNGGAFGNPSAGATNATQIGNGWYYFTPSATDTGTNGPLIVRGAEASIDDSTRDFMIAPGVWDEVNTGATHNIQNSTGKQLRTITTNTGVIYTGTAPSQAGMTSTQIKLDSGASAVNQVYQWTVISIIAGTDAGDSAIISDYNGTTKVATVELPWAIQPDNTSVFEITPTPKVQTVGTVSGNVVQWNGTNVASPVVAGIPVVGLADAYAHGGTPGSSTATLSAKSWEISNPSGDAVTLQSTGGDGRGLVVLGNGAAEGVHFTGGSTAGEAFILTSANANAFVINAGNGSDGIRINAGDGGSAINIIGLGTAGAIQIDGETGPGIVIYSNTSDAIQLLPTAGHGISILAGTGKKALLLAGSAATDALAIAAGVATPADVFNADGSVNVGNMAASALAEFFTVDSGKTFADAVFGSVVNEIASNPGGAGGVVDANVVKVLGVPVVVTGGTAQSATSNTITLDATDVALNNAYLYRQITILTGTGKGQTRYITGYVSSTKVATVNRAWTTIPDNTSTYDIDISSDVNASGGLVPPTPSEVATAVWQSLTTGGDFTTPNSIGLLLVTDVDAKISTRSTYAGGDTAGTTTLLSRLTATRAGYLDLLTNLDVAVSSRSTYAGTDTPGTTTLLARLTAPRATLLDNLIRLDANVSSRSTYAGGDTPGVTTLLSRLGSPVGASISADIAAIPTAAENADGLLGRNVEGGSDGIRTVSEAICFLRNKWTIIAGTLTVYATDDSTTKWTATVTTASSNPVTAVDPA